MCSLCNYKYHCMSCPSQSMQFFSIQSCLTCQCINGQVGIHYILFHLNRSEAHLLSWAFPISQRISCPNWQGLRQNSSFFLISSFLGYNLLTGGFFLLLIQSFCICMKVILHQFHFLGPVRDRICDFCRIKDWYGKKNILGLEQIV